MLAFDYPSPARIAQSWTNLSWVWVTKGDLYAKYDPNGTNVNGREYADKLMDAARTKAHPDPSHKKDSTMKLYRVLGDMSEGNTNRNTHNTNIVLEANATNSAEGAKAILQAAENMDTTMTFAAKGADPKFDDEALYQRCGWRRGGCFVWVQ